MGIYDEAYKLKNLIRSGWVILLGDKKDMRLESDAEHTFSMCILALEIMKKENLVLDQAKVLKMILYHEFGEIDAGDIALTDKIARVGKYDKEKTCMQRISKDCDMAEMLELWLEFEEGKTPEARFVKMIDRLDGLKQSKIYSEKAGRPEIFEEFYANSYEVVKDYLKYVK